MDKPVSTLPRAVLLYSGTDSAPIPIMSLLDSGSSNCVASPATARRWGYYDPAEPGGHGSMTVADGTDSHIYGWTGALRVYPPFHLLPSDGSARITALPPMNCLVADISEDVIVGYDYIEPLQGASPGTALSAASGSLSAPPQEHRPCWSHWLDRPCLPPSTTPCRTVTLG